MTVPEGSGAAQNENRVAVILVNYHSENYLQPCLDCVARHTHRPDRLIVADARCVHALLFGPIAPGHEVRQRTTRAVLFSVGVEGVPAIHVEEALWVTVEVLTAG